ncbi:hypothetical protein BDY24DRAFT_394438 [Mrakia frigida]|uniref:Pcf11p n=1 Tax=Mrakia frigida TaxID=29902 RepID=UPI003FCC1E62
MSHYPPQHHQHQHYQPQSSLPTEDDQFRSFFRSHLATLVVNSRPIIQSLTQVAADQLNNYSRATVVSEELVRRIHEAPPHQKLPPFYLLDSISKNFPAPYASLFPPYLHLLFLATYGSVDGSTKGKMEEMLKTWRNGGVGGGVVFGVDVQEQIEQRIWGVSELRAQQAQHQQYYQVPPPPQQYPPPPPAVALPPAPTKDSLLLDLTTALNRSHQLQHSPTPPPSISNDILALQSLQALVQTQTTTEDERRAIEAQLRKMEADAAALLPPPPPPPPAAPAPTALPAFGFLSAPGFSDLLSNVLANTQGGASPRPSTGDEGGDAEYVVPEASDDGEEVVAGGEENEVELVEKVEDVEEPDDYERLILGLNVKLEKLDLKAPLPRISTIIATLLPSQCRQCSVRAPASAKGRARLDTHMDWHYRHNKRARDSEGRGNSRAWFVDAKDWIKDPSISPDSFLPSSTSHNPSSSDPSSSASGQSGLTPAARQALMKKFVIQPADTAVACPICKESFKGEYSDDEEEWIWKNAVEFEGTIYHATCRHETLNASSALLTTRLRTTTGDISSSSTTAPSRSRSSSPAIPPPSTSTSSTSASSTSKSDPSPLAQQTNTNGSASPSAAEEVVVKVEELEIVDGAPVEKVGSKRKSIEPSSEVEEGDAEGGKKIKLSPPEAQEAVEVPAVVEEAAEVGV